MNEASGRKCPQCGAELVRTSERYAACPNGHGKLVPIAVKDQAASARIAAADRDFERRLELAEQAVKAMREQA